MKVLLDTHAFLWFILDNPQLSEVARTIIADPSREVLLSPASYWEIAIKIRLGNYFLPEPYQSFMETHIASNNFTILHILPKHTALLTTMEQHHKDPFDRLLVAQALTENIPIVSSDPHLDSYGIQRMW